jgi:hypothetical protein
MVITDHFGALAVFAAYGVVDDFVLKGLVYVCFAKKHVLGLVGYGFDVPFRVCYESVEAALIFSVDEEFVYAFDVMFSATSNHQAQLGSAEILVLRLAEELLEF